MDGWMQKDRERVSEAEKEKERPKEMLLTNFYDVTTHNLHDSWYLKIYINNLTHTPKRPKDTSKPNDALSNRLIQRTKNLKVSSNFM